MTEKRPPKAPRDPRLQALPDHLLACRAQRHDIPELADEAQRWRYRDSDVLEERRQCRRCKSVQIMQIQEHDGELYKPTKWEYIDGYLLVNPEGVEGPTPRSASRLERIRRWMERNPLPIKRHG